MAGPAASGSPLRTIARTTGLMRPYLRLYEWRRAMSFPKPPPVADDGKPLPGRLAMMRIGGTADWRFFLERGKATAEKLVQAARDAGSDPASWKRVLDWGCGCGRLARHMPALTPARIIGRDIDGFTVAWCAKNLDGDFAASSLDPPLDIDAGSIDFAYGFSVLTHLTAPRQAAWLAELGRVLKPGAIAALTFHDRAHPALAWASVEREQDGVSVTGKEVEGSNLLAAFQDITTIERAAAPWFELAGYQSLETTQFDQSLAILRRKELPGSSS